MMNTIKDALLHGVLPFVILLAALFCVGMTVIALVYVYSLVIRL